MTRTILMIICGILLPSFGIVCSGLVYAQESGGSIKGTVIDAETRQALAGVTVLVEGSKLGAYTRANGEFELQGVAVGSYTLSFRMLGYQAQVQTDVIVRPDRKTFLTVELLQTSITTEEVEISTGAFRAAAGERISVVEFNAEEVRRAPGSGGDVSRALGVLPGVAQVDNRENGLAVRGGSPMENAFYIDHIPVPNINHFPNLGNSGGAISLLNIDFVENVSMQAGGFSAHYGDRLSSVVAVDFREGNRDEIDAQLDLNASGFGGGIEGPLPGLNGSYMLSGRRSYLDLLVDGLGTGIAPRFGNIQGKIVLDLDASNRISLLDVWGQDDFIRDKEKSLDLEEDSYGEQSNIQHTVGATWRNLWSEKGFSNTSLAYSGLRHTDHWTDVDTDVLDFTRNTEEDRFSLRNTNYYRLFEAHTVEFGVDAVHTRADYDFYFSADTSSATGGYIPAFRLRDTYSMSQAGGFLSWQWAITNSFNISSGLRADYYSWNEEFRLAPRISLHWQLHPLMSLRAAGGIYYQSLQLALLAQIEDRAALETPRAVHYVLGADYLLGPDTRLSVESYYKTYKNFPLDPNDPYHLPVDKVGVETDISNSGSFVGGGEARSYGVEVLLQKKLQEDFYGLVSASVFRSEYRDLFGIWRNRSYDNRFLLTLVGGYKPDKVWEFSARWSIAGGRPFTPFDTERSTAAGRAVLDIGRAMQERMDTYHQLNLRVDRRFNFASSGLVVYMDIWNVYNKQNVAYTRWDEDSNSVETEYQWSILPVLGLEFEL